MDMNVTKAVREKLKGALALIGPSGSGKTLSALFIAYGMMKAKYPKLSEEQVWEKVGFLDTEHKRSLIYANMEKSGVNIGSFLHLDFKKPYTVERYEKGFKALKDAGAEVVIADSLSHAWEGDGGLLELQQEMGGRFQDWIKTNPYYQEFVSLVTGEMHDIHVINCVRTKQDYQVSTTETGKMNVEKLGLKPVQRDSLEYEFQVVFNIPMNHYAETSKDNSGLFEGKPVLINPEVGEKLHAWLEEGKDVGAEKRKEREPFLKEIDSFRGQSQAMDDQIAKIEEQSKRTYGTVLSGLDPDRLKRIINILKAKKMEIEKEQSEPKEEPEKKEEPKVESDPEPVKEEENSYMKTALDKIKKYRKGSAELELYIDKLEEQLKNKYDKSFKDLDDNNMAKILLTIEKKKKEIDEQVAEAKQEHKESSDGTTYWYHEESDAAFSLPEGEELAEDMDGQVEEITKEKYDELMSETSSEEQPDYDSMTKANLVKIAREKEIKGFGTMKKADLIEALKGA